MAFVKYSVAEIKPVVEGGEMPKWAEHVILGQLPEASSEDTTESEMTFDEEKETGVN